MKINLSSNYEVRQKQETLINHADNLTIAATLLSVSGLALILFSTLAAVGASLVFAPLTFVAVPLLVAALVLSLAGAACVFAKFILLSRASRLS